MVGPLERILGRAEGAIVKERSLRIGGEVLARGSKVVVFLGAIGEEREVTRVGTTWLHLARDGRDEPFDIKNRRLRGVLADYIPHFKTLAEVAALERRRDLILQLRKLGFMPVGGALDNPKQYPDEALEEVIDILSRYHNTEVQQRS